jgi:hypothetical protein
MRISTTVFSETALVCELRIRTPRKEKVPQTVLKERMREGT